MNRNISDVKAFALLKLKNLYEESEVLTLSRYLLEDFLHLYHMDPNAVLSPDQWEICTSVIQRLSNGEPYQYITGKQLFAGLWLKVSPAVLIPRPETEELFELAKTLRMSSLQKTEVIIDHCTGSGCLAIALKLAFPEASVVATDISADALQIAEENAVTYSTKIDFYKIDLLNEPFIPSKTADLVVANPPYIAPLETSDMHANVYKYEPHLALFTPENDPLIFYRKILQSAIEYLSPGGTIALEINPPYAQELLHIASYYYEVAELKKDLSGKDRFLITHLNSR